MAHVNCVTCGGAFEAFSTHDVPVCSPGCMNAYVDEKAAANYCHDCNGPCLGHADPVIYCDQCDGVCKDEILSSDEGVFCCEACEDEFLSHDDSLTADEWNRDYLLAQQELEDFENLEPERDYIEDGYLDSAWESQNEYYDGGDY